jgi:hypothetical protein
MYDQHPKSAEHRRFVTEGLPAGVAKSIAVPSIRLASCVFTCLIVLVIRNGLRAVMTLAGGEAGVLGEKCDALGIRYSIVKELHSAAVKRMRKANRCACFALDRDPVTASSLK